MLDHLHRLYDHLAWADARALASLRAAGTSSPMLDRAHEILAHTVGAEEVWLARIQGRTPTVPVWPTLTLDELADLAARTHEGFRALVAALDEDGARRVIHYRNSAGAEFDTPLDDLLLHVALHGSYHRGQVSLLVRDAGAEPSPTDFVAFVRGAPAATRATSIV
jgi:uncharacterized damage-inducible protein DinB